MCLSAFVSALRTHDMERHELPIIIINKLTKFNKSQVQTSDLLFLSHSLPSVSRPPLLFLSFFLSFSFFFFKAQDETCMQSYSFKPDSTCMQCCRRSAKPFEKQFMQSTPFRFPPFTVLPGVFICCDLFLQSTSWTGAGLRLGSNDSPSPPNPHPSPHPQPPTPHLRSPRPLPTPSTLPPHRSGPVGSRTLTVFLAR